ncbi:MAG TPA: hypothetical protein VHE09_03855, partial [Rhizomicrobium sp.]|nr:hypothetical protein [Rhizomicrobium sp.]
MTTVMGAYISGASGIITSKQPARRHCKKGLTSHRNNLRLWVIVADGIGGETRLFDVGWDVVSCGRSGVASRRFSRSRDSRLLRGARL